jgi:hypothetical protein
MIIVRIFSSNENRNSLLIYKDQRKSTIISMWGSAEFCWSQDDVLIFEILGTVAICHTFIGISLNTFQLVIFDVKCTYRYILYIIHIICISYTYFNWNTLWCAVSPINNKSIHLMTQKIKFLKVLVPFLLNETEARSKYCHIHCNTLPWFLILNFRCVQY